MNPGLDEVVERDIADERSRSAIRLTKLLPGSATVAPIPPIFGNHHLRPSCNRPGRERFLAEVSDAHVLGNICAALKQNGPRSFDYLRDGPDMSLDEGRDFAELFPVHDGGRHSIMAVEPTASTSRAILCGNRHTNNYFHFMVDGLARLHLADLQIGDEGAPGVFGNMPASHVDILRLLWPERRFFFLEYGEVLAVRQLCIPRASTFSPFSGPETAYSTYDSEMLAVLRKKLSALAMPLWRKPGEILYLSRQLLASGTHSSVPARQVSNEAEILAALGNEVQVVHPERLLLSEQIERIASASVIIAQAGSALASLVFARPGAAVIILCHNRAGSVGYFDILAQVCGLLIAYVAGAPASDDVHAPIRVKVSDLREAMAWAGISR